MKFSLDQGWRFHLGDIDSPVPPNKHIAAYMANKAGWARGAAKGNYDDSDWRTVDLPHDWSVEGALEKSNYIDNGYLPRGIGWYRRHFRLEESDRGKYLAIQFDGVATHCTVYVNGHVLHRNWCGYTSFTVDISDVATFGEAINVIAVRVDATYIEGWWYEGAGIYRHTWLIKSPPVHIEPWSVFVLPQKDGEVWDTRIETRIANRSDAQITAQLCSTLLDPAGVAVGSSKISIMLADRSSSAYLQSVPITAPQLWSTESPACYQVHTELRINHHTADEESTTVGFRTIRFDADNGFFLNDQPTKLKGVCVHQDHAGVGVAVPDSIQEFRIRRLKEMGCNAIRTAHNPPAPELLDACDRLGMLVMNENRNFGSSPEHLSQLRSMVMRDRNHPSVILWSLCNEEAIQGTPAAASIAKAMQNEVKQLDPSRPVTAGVSGGLLNDDSIADSIEVMGINYLLASHDAYHAKHPKRAMVATENNCVLSTRGEYVTDPAKHRFESYGTEKAFWGNTAGETWRHVSERPFVAGMFAWTGFDYRGEPSPHDWPSVSTHWGILDTCGFEKDAFCLHKAWFDAEGAPFVHLLPHWTWPGREGTSIRVMAFSNCESVELFLNDESLGRKPVDSIEMVEWTVPYRAGELRAIGYRSNQVVETNHHTTGPAVAIGLEVHPSADVTEILADGAFAIPITVFATDALDRRVPVASPLVGLAIEGPAKIIGVGNGDPTCLESDKGSSRSLFNGLAQVIVQTMKDSGRFTLVATSEGLRAASLSLTSAKCDPRPAIEPATVRYFITDWRLSPITATRPDPNQAIADQDMNSWERIEPGSPQKQWSAGGGYAVYRATFTPPKVVQVRGGRVVFHGLAGDAEVYLNGMKHPSGAVAVGASSSPQTLSVLVRAGQPPAGLTGRVEIVPS